MSSTKSPDSGANSHGVDDVDTEDGLTDVDSQPMASRLRLVGLVAAVVLTLDQITKIWAVESLTTRDIDLFWTLRLHLIRNTGSAFGFGSGFGRWLSLLIVVVILVVLRYASRTDHRLMRILFGGIVGGAVGNLIDRALRADDGFMTGGVVDFIDLQWWPVFNIADMAVVGGALGLMLISMREPQ